MKLAIVGGGPSAFYVAARLLSRSADPALRVHVFDRLWAPHGLVRYGVAPDHPEVKNCTHKFDTVASDSRFRFFGNVNVGAPPPPAFAHALHLPLSTLHSHYSHLLFATGCTLPAHHSALANAPWCIPALSFVHWYTKHPAAPPPPPLHLLDHVSLIGNGNVALDVARILLAPLSRLEKYDIPGSVLTALAASTVRHVSIIARRGPLQAAFTAKELRELTSLPDTSMKPLDPALLEVPPGEIPTRQQARVLQLLAQGSRERYGHTPRSWSLEFFRAPLGIEPASAPDAGAMLSLAPTVLDSEGRAVRIPDAPSEKLRTSLVITSLGFRGEPDAPYFDQEMGHLRARAGRVIGADARPVKGVYASGWAAMGARGVLATTMMDAYGVADVMLADADSTASESTADGEQLMNPAPTDDAPPAMVQAGLAAGRVVEYADWQRIDAEEVRRGEALGKERERMGWAEADAVLRTAKGQ
ncbi:hypothetical protein B0H15DRAFT_835947 [Mycena belliarum]|uniref:NADPH:adrenodoxin oxidoreductase, mitochondrial n=1 Tax=Mycena belliarum TaxID=1033014 RepID=A0AAD6U7V9_9AGAR|nr:hypothetical protein B0H15DRAFT_835947 [Mycena belliae]